MMKTHPMKTLTRNYSRSLLHKLSGIKGCTGNSMNFGIYVARNFIMVDLIPTAIDHKLVENMQDINDASMDKLATNVGSGTRVPEGASAPFTCE
eukprot:902715-Karenia_brevis.AAC.1